MGNLSSCSIESCNKFIKEKLQEIEKNESINVYRNNMKKKGLDIDKSQAEAIRLLLFNTSELNKKYLTLMKKRGKNQVVSFVFGSKKQRRIKQRRSKQRRSIKRI